MTSNEEELQKLKEENEFLKHKLDVARKWMHREVIEQIHKIAQRKVGKMSYADRDSFLRENFEEVISSKMSSYFGDILLLNAPKGMLEAITTSEINFYNMQKNPSIDGFTVISGYHKALDLMVESFITTNFRRFAKKKGQTILRQNDHVEKFLHMVVNKKYILSVGRLYALLKMIKEDSIQYDYAKIFKEYLEKYKDLSNVLLDEDFLSKFTKLNKSEVLSTKRHSGSIVAEETKIARNLLVGDLSDKSSMIYRLLESQSVFY